jgi:two-component system chemotaxis response regulator CheB
MMSRAARVGGCGGSLRVLVVDDSVVVRQLVARVLGAEPLMEVVGVAANGRVALEKIARLGPDVVLLDLEMPVMGGLETLVEIRRRDPRLPVIVFSHLTAVGAEATLEALALGASGFALKPSADGIGMAQELVRAELVPLIRGVARRSSAPPPVPASAGGVVGGGRPGRVSVVVVGVSTGGPNALAEIVPALPVGLAVAVLVVQHMPVVFTRLLAERLDRLSVVGVGEAVDGELVVAGRVYIAPGGRHLSLAGSGVGVRVVLGDGPPENSCRPAVDVLFRAAVACYGSETLAVVLTGMGRDGLRGAGVVRAAGGFVVAQSEQSAVVASMPAAVAAAGLADAVVPLDQIAAKLIDWTTPGGTQ